MQNKSETKLIVSDLQDKSETKVIVSDLYNAR